MRFQIPLEEIFNASSMHNYFVGVNTYRNEFCYFEFTYTGTTLVITNSVSSYNSTYKKAHNSSIYINDVFYCDIENFNSTVGVTIVLPSGSKNIKIFDGAQMTPFAIDTATTPTGTYITSILAEKGRHSVISSKSVTNKIVWLADSIGSGYHTYNNTTEAFSRLFYQRLGYDLAYIGGSSERLSFIASTTTQRDLIRGYINTFLSNVTGNKKLVFQVGTNDYGAGVTKANFKSYADAVIQTLIADHPTIKIYLMAAFPRSEETSLLQDLRDAYNELSVTYSSNCVYIPSNTFITLADCYDGLHPTSKVVHESIYNQLVPYITA
jgi:hypothetical protein